MLIQNLHDLAPTQERAIIINANTKLVTTLAVLSAIRYAGMPVLLIECQSNDGSFEHFSTLMKKYKFDMISAPLHVHGLTLDWIFQNITSEKVLLIDSDLEIRDSTIITFCKEYIDEFNVFGCGFTNGPAWLTNPIFEDTHLEGALFIERMWIPFTLLKVAPVRKAINNGKSFVNFDEDNEYSRLPFFARFRSKFSVSKNLLKHSPIWLRRSIHGLRPAMLCYDTGAQIFEYLRYEYFMTFVGLPESASQKYVTHYRGITRNTLDPTDTFGGGGLTAISDDVRQRLLNIYEEDVS